MQNKILLCVFALAAVAMLSAAELPKALVDPYLKIQSALASDKFEGIAADAKAIETSAAALGSEADALVVSAKKLEAAKTIDAARNAFGEVSEALVTYAEKTKTELGADIRVAYCPMVNKPWLQKEKEIKNPYYGTSMISCGSFKK